VLGSLVQAIGLLATLVGAKVKEINKCMMLLLGLSIVDHSKIAARVALSIVAHSRIAAGVGKL
jgi:hypothetical protein